MTHRDGSCTRDLRSCFTLAADAERSHLAQGITNENAHVHDGIENKKHRPSRCQREAAGRQRLVGAVYWLTDSFRPLPALNFGCLDAGI